MHHTFRKIVTDGLGTFARPSLLDNLPISVQCCFLANTESFLDLPWGSEFKNFVSRHLECRRKHASLMFCRLVWCDIVWPLIGQRHPCFWSSPGMKNYVSQFVNQCCDCT